MIMVVSAVSVHAYSPMATVSKGSMRLASGKVMDAIIGRTVRGVEAIIPMVSARAQPLSSHQVTVGCMKETWRTISS